MTPRRERAHGARSQGKSPFAVPCERREEPRPLTACRACYHGRGARRQLWVAVPRAAAGRRGRCPPTMMQTSPSVSGGEEQETTRTRSRPAVLRGPSATRLRSFPSANLLGTSRDVARVTADANERPAPSGAGARQALHPSLFSSHRFSMTPLLAEKHTPTNHNTSSRGRNSGVEKIQLIEIGDKFWRSGWIRHVGTVSITATMRVTSTVSVPVGMAQAARKLRMRFSTPARGRPKRRALCSIRRCGSG